MSTYYTDSGNTIHLGSQIDKGGEGTIYLIQGYPSEVAKIYTKFQPPEVHRKILAMLQNLPHDPTINGPTKHRSIAWPSDILYLDRQKKQFAGFMMPRIDMKIFKKILNYISPDDRVKSFMGGFTWLHLYTTAYNLASCVAAIHERDYCIGDLNESNVLVQPTTPLTVIDCDSFQVQDSSSGKIWRCKVGKPEYTAPELLGKKYEDVDRTHETDCFALAIMIFQLLMEGFHPYQATGSLVNNAPLTHDKIRQGIFAYSTSIKEIAPPPDAPSFDILHPEIRSLFLRCFDTGHKEPSLRPSAKEWMTVFKKLSQNFKKCSANENHRYLDHLDACPWCIRANKTGKDTFPNPIGQQIQLLDPNNQVISKQEREAYLLTFIEMALADGYLSHEEEIYLIDQGLKLHIPEKDTKKFITNEIQRKGLTKSSSWNPILHLNNNYIDISNVKKVTILSEYIEIDNAGASILTGTVSSNVPWITVPSTFPSCMKNQIQKIQLTIDTNNLPYGYSGTGVITLRTNGGTATVTINLSIENASVPTTPILTKQPPSKIPLWPFILVGLLFFIIIVGSLSDKKPIPQNNTNSKEQNQRVSEPINYQTLKNGRYIQTEKSVGLSYFEEKFKFILQSVDVGGDKIVLNIILNNFMNVKAKFLCGNGITQYYVKGSGIRYSQPKTYNAPYLIDEFGNKYDVINPPIKGEVANYFFEDMGWGGDGTVKVALPPNSIINAQMEFPRISNNTRYISLVVPGLIGWQGDIKINEIQLTQGDNSFELSDTKYSTQEQQRTDETINNSVHLSDSQMENKTTYNPDGRESVVTPQPRQTTHDETTIQRKSFEPPSSPLRSDGWKKSRESVTYEDN